MAVKITGRINAGILLLIILILVAFAGCEAPAKPFTIGVVSQVSLHSPVLEGFKAGLAELGYIEGKNIKYIYNGVLENNQKIIDDEIEKLLAQDIDLLLSLGNEVGLRAKKAVEGTDMPVLVSACYRPIEAGLIETMRRPGGNITGVASAGTTSKALELMKLTVPGLRKVYLPYNPDDEISVVGLAGLDKAASQLGIELMLLKVHSVEDAVAAIETLPKNDDAIFRIPSPTLDRRGSELNRAAIDRAIPMVTSVPSDKDVLMSLATDLYDMGKKTSRLAHQIRQGVKPVDLPMETSEVDLTINLKTAEEIGISIPDDVLVQAKTIIR